MPAFVFLSFTCQLGQEGEGARLIDLARRLTQHPRGLACLFGDGVSGYAQQHHNNT